METTIERPIEPVAQKIKPSNTLPGRTYYSNFGPNNNRSSSWSGPSPAFVCKGQAGSARASLRSSVNRQPLAVRTMAPPRPRRARVGRLPTPAEQDRLRVFLLSSGVS
ncbi:hypothetical protein GQ55_6G276600 [Panicum hallii var. hallii]|uniref:Uncharacterized protein n=1 Tax=Panicum hallii var. hallii TaxID=1504633 RepID=A0A2T7DAH4_9POAL|nr:hypothetical protein GQ55_6G276600 [Panicum hallii var. hallii]